MAAFSRLQLAAALLEYDNDSSNPDAPYRSAHESAIFAHLRRTNEPRDFLKVSIPSESGSLGGRESVLDGRRSRNSIDALRNPFGADETVDGLDDEEEELEVDLASWGLDSFMPKEKGSKKKGKSAALPNPHPVPSLRRRPDVDAGAMQRRTSTARSMSLGYSNSFGAGGAFLDASSTSGHPPDNSHTTSLNLHHRPASFHGLIEQVQETQPQQSIPFPSLSPRSGSPVPNQNETRSLRRHSDLDTRLRPTLTPSGRDLLSDEAHNPFSVEPPSPARASRFDPKASHARAMSSSSMGLGEGNARPSSRASMLDSKVAAHARTVSNASMGSRMLLDNDGVSVMTGQGQYGQDRPYSTLELMRPKVLVMPSPLQPVTGPPSPPPVAGRDGFQLSVRPPLPPGARTARRGSALIDSIEPSSHVVPIASNSFTPNPRMSLTLSQLTFRNTLVVGGERDVSYADLDRDLNRATEDGEQIQPDSPIEELPEPEPAPRVDPSQNRPAGKLFGKSLIDDLENRKSQMRSKQRVFTGDERPSMMARAHRSSTLIDPATLHAKPVPQPLNSSRSPGAQQAADRRASLSIKPLLNFDGDEQPLKTNLATDTRIPNTRSVFGVDTIWEREMVKLREIEAQEKIEAEELRKREEAKQNRKRKGRGKGKGKSKDDVPERTQESSTADPHVDAPRVSAEPPVLPSIPKATTRRRPRSVVDNDDNESSSSVGSAEIPQSPGSRDRRDEEAQLWLAGSSDEDDRGPRRTTGVGPRYPRALQNEDSEEDLPLAIAVERAAQRATRGAASSDGSDEEKPLSVLLQKAKLSLPSINSNNSPSSKLVAADDDDDEPLGLRASKFLSSPQVFKPMQEDQEDDDRPLAFHPEQQRRTQYQMLAQHQQMMMQAQLHNSMFFGAPPAMMGSGFFAQSMAAPLMMPPPQMPMPSPPPSHDAAKFSQVDRWRRDVVVEGKP